MVQRMMKYLFYSKDGSSKNCYMDILVGSEHYYLTRSSEFYHFKLPGEAHKMKVIVEDAMRGLNNQLYYSDMGIAYIRKEQ